MVQPVSKSPQSRPKTFIGTGSTDIRCLTLLTSSETWIQAVFKERLQGACLKLLGPLTVLMQQDLTVLVSCYDPFPYSSLSGSWAQYESNPTCLRWTLEADLYFKVLTSEPCSGRPLHQEDVSKLCWLGAFLFLNNAQTSVCAAIICQFLHLADSNTQLVRFHRSWHHSSAEDWWAPSMWISPSSTWLQKTINHGCLHAPCEAVADV